MGLYSLKLYVPLMLKLIIAFECLAFCALIVKGGGIEFNWPDQAEPETDSDPKPIQLRLGRLLALASILSFALLAWQSFGSIFHIYDDILNWDFWATRWAGQLEISRTSFYPQLLPCNWSITYVLIENTDVKMFAKAIMPLFPLATLLLFLDGFRKTKNRRWLYGTVCYALILQYFFSKNFLASGYADVPCAFFAFLSYYAVDQLETACLKDSFLNNLLPLVFASAAASTKQGGLYLVLWALCWLSMRLWKRNDPNLLKKLAQSVALAAGLNHWYLYKTWRFSFAYESNNLAELEALQMGRSYWLRWIESFDMLRAWRGFEGQPIFFAAMALTTSSLYLRQSRIVFFTLVLPIYTIWALFFSYAPRNLGLVLPFLAFCCGSGFEVIETTIGRLSAQIKAYKASWLTKELCKPIAVLLLGVGVSIFVCLQPVHSLTIIPQGSVSDELLMELAGSWYVPTALAAVIIALSTIACKQTLVVRLPALSLFAIFFFVGFSLLVFENTVLPRQRLIDEQIALRRTICAPKLNAKLYACIDQGIVTGKIASSYSAMHLLPDLERYSLWSPLLTRKPLTVNDVESLRGDPETKAMLIWSSTITPELSNWLKERHYTILFEESERSLVLFPVDENH